VIRSRLLELYRQVIFNFAHKLNSTELSNSAIVFAPHMDDETLGCGGTIINKIKAGAAIQIVYMTDGSHSHSLLPAETLRAIRKEEALAAGQILGVNKDQIVFLGFEDGKLKQHLAQATGAVTEILRTHQPAEVFIPYRKGGHEDHDTTNLIVMKALEQYGAQVVVNEYAIWLWYRWPWITTDIRKKHGLRFLIRSVKKELKFVKEFRYAIKIDDVLNTKTLALNQHKSQVTRLYGNEKWFTLNDISNGEWLQCLLQTHELFRRYAINSK
jgi:LmbE family N-acetylglucosaminyl deacetylase